VVRVCALCIVVRFGRNRGRERATFQSLSLKPPARRLKRTDRAHFGLPAFRLTRTDKVFGMPCTDVVVAKGKKFAESLNLLSFCSACQQPFHGWGSGGETGRQALASYRVNIRSPGAQQCGHCDFVTVDCTPERSFA
jgi:hypothetical protein